MTQGRRAHLQDLGVGCALDHRQIRDGEQHQRQQRDGPRARQHPGRGVPPLRGLEPRGAPAGQPLQKWRLRECTASTASADGVVVVVARRVDVPHQRVEREPQAQQRTAQPDASNQVTELRPSSTRWQLRSGTCTKGGTPRTGSSQFDTKCLAAARERMHACGAHTVRVAGVEQRLVLARHCGASRALRSAGAHSGS